MSDPKGNHKVIESDDEMEMQAFCAAVGELILWGSAIDSQLTKAVIGLCLVNVPDTPMLESVIAELPVRAKSGLLLDYAKHITASDWSSEIKTWVNKAQKAYDNRNIVAHHQVGHEDGKPILFSQNARKVLKRIDGSEVKPPKTVDDIHAWIELAKEALCREILF